MSAKVLALSDLHTAGAPSLARPWTFQQQGCAFEVRSRVGTVIAVVAFDARGAGPDSTVLTKGQARAVAAAIVRLPLAPLSVAA